MRMFNPAALAIAAFLLGLASASARDGIGYHRTTSPQMTGVLIIDDHPIVTQGCRPLLEDARVTEIDAARDIADGYGQYRAHRPDVIILDLTIGKSELAASHSFNACVVETGKRQYSSLRCTMIH